MGISKYLDTTAIDNALDKGVSAYDVVQNLKTVAVTGSYNDLTDKPTKSTLGLGNVDNTSDLSKPISTATQTAINNLQSQLDSAVSSVTVDSEVQQARVGTDRTTYGSLNTRISTEVTNLKEDLTNAETYIGRNGKASLALSSFDISGNTKTKVTDFLIIKNVEYTFKNVDSQDSKITIAVDQHYGDAHYDVGRGETKAYTFPVTGLLKVWDNAATETSVTHIEVKATNAVDGSDFENAITGSNQVITNSSFDLNNCEINKIYLIATTCVNSPINQSGTVFTVSCRPIASSYHQLYIAESGKLYIRYKKNGSWGNWVNMVAWSDNPLTGSGTVLSSSDFDIDNCEVNKIYTAITTCINAPVDIGGTIVTFGHTNSANARGQIYLAQTGALYSRFKSGAGWTRWYGTSESQSEIFDFAKLSLFSRVGVIGDSFASGAIYSPSGADLGSIYRISWIQQLARRNGFTGVNFSRGGLSTRTWLTDAQGLSKLNSEDVCGLYILALGINDWNGLGRDYLGTPADIGTNADTFYGNYSKIINAVKAKSTSARIVICTNADTKRDNMKPLVRDFNEAIRTLAVHFDIPCVDIFSETYFNSEFYFSSMYGGHPTAPAYSAMATAYENAISRCMMENFEYFENGDYTS